MSTLRKLLFFFLVLVIFGVGGYAQTEFEEQRRLARQGNAQAQAYIGYSYSKGRGVPRDYKEAFKWYRKAAEQSIAKAQFNVG